MSDENEVYTLAQIVALRLMVADIMAVLAAASGDADKFAERLRQAAREEAQHVPYPGIDPVKGEEFSSEVENALEFLWMDVAASIARLKQGAKRS